MPDAGNHALIQALHDIAKKTKLIPPEFVSRFPKNGQAFLRVLADENAEAKDIVRQSGLFCGEVFNEKSGKNLEHQDENVLALWMIGTLINELCDAEKINSLDLFTAQKEKILDLLEKEPFFAKVVEVSVAPIVETVEIVEIPIEMVSPTAEEKTPVVEPAVVTPVSVPEPVPAKESITVRLEKIRAEIAEKAKSLDINKIKAELTESIKSMHLDKMKEVIEAKTKAGFSAIKNLFRKK